MDISRVAKNRKQNSRGRKNHRFTNHGIIKCSFARLAKLKMLTQASRKKYREPFGKLRSILHEGPEMHSYRLYYVSYTLSTYSDSFEAAVHTEAHGTKWRPSAVLCSLHFCRDLFVQTNSRTHSTFHKCYYLMLLEDL